MHCVQSGFVIVVDVVSHVYVCSVVIIIRSSAIQLFIIIYQMHLNSRFSFVEILVFNFCFVLLLLVLCLLFLLNQFILSISSRTRFESMHVSQLFSVLHSNLDSEFRNNRNNKTNWIV